MKRKELEKKSKEELVQMLDDIYKLKLIPLNWYVKASQLALEQIDENHTLKKELEITRQKAEA